MIPSEDTTLEDKPSALFGFRKFFLSLVALVFLFVAILTGHIEGDTGAWAIVALMSLVFTGYAGEYFLKQGKKPSNE